ncbi:uncharacterized protein LOC127836657 [Dreissena polymorpha]|uniref:uncharacterized protein LOC127836657 n=1 Tax=Dreissena polymorpha TaxID=45954 RepID=UPI0022642436|nr:uncharacterized protein LOC127836657 [Dreissena polymorpha]
MRIKMLWKCGLIILAIVSNIYYTGAQNPVLTSNATSVKVNESILLTCTHPTATVVRWWRQPAGENSLSLILAMNNQCEFIPTTIPDVFSTCVCSGTTFMCTLRPLDTINNEDKWKCSVTENKQHIFSIETTIIITVPVAYANLTSDVPTISVLPNVAISYIRCVSSVGRPAPSITWYLDNKTPSNYSDDVDLTLNSSSLTVADVTTSILSMMLFANYHDARIYCNVSNGFGQIMSNRTLKINVLSYPTKPTIYYNTVIVPSSISVIKSTSMTLECSSSGNPEPSFLWTLFNGSLISSSVITFKVATNNDKEQIVCSAASVLDPTNGPRISAGNTTVITMNTLYAPETPQFSFQTCEMYSQTNHLKVIRGHSVSGRCTVKSEPGSTFLWTPANSGIGDGFFINNVSREHSGNYTCIANNEMNTTFGGIINGINKSNFYLNVLVPADAQFIGNITVLWNTTSSVTCPYTPGNPPETRFSWFRGNTSVGSHQNLSLSNVQLSGEGYYKCRVNNTMDPTGCSTQETYDETSFYVDVQYPAKISSFYVDGSNFASSVTINESQTVMLLCEADSDPLAKLELVNISKGDERLLVKAQNNTISALVANARCEFDMGVYQCKGKNDHNTVQQVRELEIKITCSPRSSPFAPPITTVYKRENASAILSCTFVAYPPPNDASAYVWRKQVDGEWVTLHNISRFQIILSNDSLQTNLSISHLQIDDFTNYSVRVNNTVGSTEQTFVIRANEQPSMPQQLHVVDAMVTQNYIEVKWTPGFNGGEEQWFVIGYKKAADESWTYINVSSIVTQLSIGDLVAGTKYEVKMYAENIIGKSDDTIVLSVTTQSVISDGRNSPLAAIGGVAGGGIAAIVLIIIVVVVIRKRRNNETMKEHPQRTSKSKKKQNTVYVNSLFGTTSEEGVKKEATAGIIINSTKQRDNNKSSPQLGDGLQRTPSFVIVHEPLYGNAGDFTLKIRSIQIQELRVFTLQSKKDPTDIFRNFYSLDTGLKFETSVARIDVNLPKNRYRNMYPYDKNRVVLPAFDGEESDFINASFIDGYGKRKKYIAAQGPLERTIPDIWRMILAENIKAVAMVTNTIEEGKRKCFQYWPEDTRNPCKHAHFNISLIEQENYADFVIRKLQCVHEKSKKVHTVHQCHFTAWPDTDVPDTALSLLQFWRKVHSFADTVTSPLLVHCSAGVGRTGTCIALDYLYDQGIAVHEINVHEAVKALRDQRINMVQTKNQYLFLHEVLCEVLDPIGKVVQNKEYLTTNFVMHSGIGSEFKRIREAEEFNATQATNDKLAAEDRFKPMLLHSTTGDSNYVNAVYINTFRERNKLILTPGTTDGSTDVDFLWLLHDHKLKTVVILNEKMESYIPDQGRNTVTGPFSGKLVSKSTQSHYEELVVKYQYYAEHESFDVRFLLFSSWQKKTKVCKISDLMHLLIGAQDLASDCQMVVQCRDGNTRSGLFAVLWCIVERIKRDGEVAVAESVRMVKRRCQRIIPNEEQYRFCYEFAKQYADGCNTYENTEDGIRGKK